MGKNEQIYEKRFAKHVDELKWLYMELYNSQEMFEKLELDTGKIRKG